MDFKLIIKSDRKYQTIPKGRPSHSRDLQEQIKSMTKRHAIIIPTTREEQHLAARRLRSLIFKWKVRKNLPMISVNMLDDGTIRLSLT